MSEKKNALVALDGTATSGVNIVSELNFVLLGTSMTMGFAKLEDKNTFVIIPTPGGKTEGITVEKMIDDITKLINDYDPSLVPADLTAENITGAIKDVNEASQTKKKNPNDESVDYNSITIYLRQAFLLLQTGNPVEYAFNITVDLSKLFPSDMSFINVVDFQLSVWNTDRANILSRMDVTNLNALLEAK